MAQREGEEARRQAAALASVAALANAAAHEINNPLSIIMGNLELFRRRPDVPGVVAGRAEAMLAAGRRIAGIVGSMRRITRLENVPSPSGLPAMLDLKRSSTADDA
jgi:signal transduction histidine kinase